MGNKCDKSAVVTESKIKRKLAYIVVACGRNRLASSDLTCEQSNTMEILSLKPLKKDHIGSKTESDFQILLPLPVGLCCPSQTLLLWQIFFPAGQTLDSPLDRGTGNKQVPMASACYAKEHVRIDAFGILSPIDLPSASHIYTF